VVWEVGAIGGIARLGLAVLAEGVRVGVDWYLVLVLPHHQHKTNPTPPPDTHS